MYRAVGKYAWILFFALGFLAVIAGVSIVAGVLSNPPSAESTTGLTMGQIVARIPGIGGYIGGLSRQLGNFMIAMGVLLASLAGHSCGKWMSDRSCWS